MEVLKIGSWGEAVRELQTLLKIKVSGVYDAETEVEVIKYQKSHGLKADGIAGEKTLNSLKSKTNSPRLTKSKRKINKIIIHCSATHEGQPFTIENIRQWHKQRGFTDIGYHYVVYLDGTVHLGRNIDLIGAHCTGHNANSIGICYIGGLESGSAKPKDTRTPSQKLALSVLLEELKRIYPSATIHGHNEFANKSCPCFNVKKEYGNL